MPGVVLLKLRPQAVAELSSPLSRGSVTISAANGRTTTARLVDAIAHDAGWATVANTAGSNLLRGVAAALLAQPDNAELGVFEVDEAALPATAQQLQPRVILLMNLFRDQLDRYGELETLVATWKTMISTLGPQTVLVLNADDPSVAYLGHDRPNTVYFSVNVGELGRATMAHAADSTHCPRCDGPLHYSQIAIAHMGHWRCTSCGLQRPEPTVRAQHVKLRGLNGADMTISATDPTLDMPVEIDVALNLAGVHNVYNATAAAAAGLALGAPHHVLSAALGRTDAAFGRGERVKLWGRELLLLLAKNPAGANENVRACQLADGEIHLLVALNDRTADGQDVSWIWDVDYEPLFERLASVTITGDRAHDMALRFAYGGVDQRTMHVEPDISAALDTAINQAQQGDTIFALPTYTAMLDLRADLVRRGVANEFWEDQ